MELKRGAIALLASSLLFLALALATGGLVFYAALVAATAILAADGYRFITARSDLRRRLAVTKSLSGSDLLVGATLAVTYSLEYGGRRTIPVQCLQPAGRDLEVKEPLVRLDLAPGHHAIEYSVVLASRGRHTIGGLRMTFESAFFRGTLTAGGDREISVYPAIEAHPDRVSRRSLLHSPVIEAVRQGPGSDFSHVRAYMPGDSARNIDWARSSRCGTLVVKDFEETRTMPVFILIDTDASMEAGDKKTELESAIEVATLLSGRALLQNERVGIACFSRSEVTAYLPPAAGKAQMARIRQLLASVRPGRGAAEPRRGATLLQDAIAAQKAFEGAGPVMEEAIRQFTANVREDGFIKAVMRASAATCVPCNVVVATNLSMGMASLLSGVRIAGYYGHRVTVALAPHVWFGPGEGIDPEGFFRKYREATEQAACLRSRRVDVIELSAAMRPEEAIASSRGRRPSRALR